MVRKRITASGLSGWQYGIVISKAEASERDDCERIPDLLDAADRAAERPRRYL
jgi:hypothetical protein